jgi:hypothetical protein
MYVYCAVPNIYTAAAELLLFARTCSTAFQNRTVVVCSFLLQTTREVQRLQIVNPKSQGYKSVREVDLNSTHAVPRLDGLSDFQNSLSLTTKHCGHWRSNSACQRPLHATSSAQGEPLLMWVKDTCEIFRAYSRYINE